MPRVLLLLPTTTYRTAAFLAAAERLGVEVTVASEEPSTLARLNPAGLLTLDFGEPEHAARQVVEFAVRYPIDAVVPVDSQVAVVGAAIGRACELRHNSVDSVAAAQDKLRAHRRFDEAGVPAPRYWAGSFDEDPAELARRVDYPCVVKPLSLAASQGVIRANNEAELVCAVARIERILDGHCGGQYLVEEFVPGAEVALEGMLSRGALDVLALFDKPDPLLGPYFEESIYITPSRLPPGVQQEIARCTEQATRALGLAEGPIHAELRLTADGPRVIEINPRSIGGLCSRVLRFGTGLSLEELIIRHALDREFEPPDREPRPAGVMMIPIPRAGRLVEVAGVEQAKAVDAVEDVVISARPGTQLAPPPEGSRYLGFIFARADSTEAVEAALRESHRRLTVAIEPEGGEETTSGIYHCLVRYGSPGHVARFGAIERIACRRGDRVVVHTERGLEVGEVLHPPQEVAADEGGARATGELLRVLTPEDQRHEESLGDAHQQVLRACAKFLAERQIPVTVIDAEQLFDGRTIILYYLGEATEKLGPVAVELGRTTKARVQFQPVEPKGSEAEREAAEPVDQPQAKQSKAERLKQSSRYLRGTIAEELAQSSDKFSSDDASLLKFHGIYQQDDRDARKSRNPAAGKAGRNYIFMVRTKVPGGKLTAGQLLAELDLGDRMANGTLRITSRQGLQLHGVVKGNLWATVHGIDRALLTTLGACGDTSRNVMCCPAPHPNDRVHSAMQATANDIARHLTPQSRAYYEIWVDEEKVLARSAGDDVEPLYGQTYLPRKFKIGIALPEDNCIDVYTQDIGLLAVAEAGELMGYNVLVGGGLGTTPSVKETFPRLADPLAFVPYGDVLRVVTAIFQVQRDYGNREDRRRARMKYLIEQWGVPRFKAQVETYLGGERLAEPRPLDVHGYDDHLGWRPQGDERFYFGIPIENGRIKDDGACRMKSGLRRLLTRFRMPVRLTPGQNLLLYDLDAGSRDEIFAIAGEHGIRTHDEISLARRFSLACTALPTCGLAITDAERVMPGVVDQLDRELARLGLSAAPFTIRMTGCPNGCARPYTSDIGLVGKAAGKYTIFVGGRLLGDRLNVLYKELVPLEHVVEQLVPLLVYYKSDRREEESLGDFCHRKGVDELLRFDAEYSPPGYLKEERR